MRITLLILLLALAACVSGCASTILFPIDKQDIVIMSKGSSYTPDRDGFFLSKLYMEEVVKAKVRK